MQNNNYNVFTYIPQSLCVKHDNFILIVKYIRTMK